MIFSIIKNKNSHNIPGISKRSLVDQLVEGVLESMVLHLRGVDDRDHLSDESLKGG